MIIVAHLLKSGEDNLKNTYNIMNGLMKLKLGYTSYELFLPKFTRTDKPIALLNSQTDPVCKFDPAVHIRKKKVENVTDFGSSPTENPFNSSTSISDFDLD